MTTVLRSSIRMMNGSGQITHRPYHIIERKTLFCVRWKMRYLIPTMSLPFSLKKPSLTTVLLWSPVLFLTIFQVILIYSYSISLPYYDEWDYIGSDTLTTSLSWEWLFAQHNEHRIVLTKLQIWLLYKLNGWNHIATLFINFALFLTIIAALCYYAFKELSHGRYLIPLSAALLLSPLNYENHLWGFQSQFHFAILFQILLLFTAFRSPFTLSHAVQTSILSILAMYSMSFGTAMQFPTILSVTLYWLYKDARGSWKNVVVFNLLTVSSLIYWLTYYNKPGHHPPLVMPWTTEFWIYFFNLLSFGFGYSSLNIWIGMAIFIFITAGLILLLSKDQSPHAAAWSMLAISIMIALACISMARAELGLSGSKSSRYVEVGMVLFFTAIVLWSKATKHKASPTAFALFLLAFTGFSNDWNAKGYSEKWEQGQISLSCLRAHKNGLEEFTCPTLYHSALRAKVTFAKEHKFLLVDSF